MGFQKRFVNFKIRKLKGKIVLLWKNTRKKTKWKTRKREEKTGNRRLTFPKQVQGRLRKKGKRASHITRQRVLGYVFRRYQGT